MTVLSERYQVSSAELQYNDCCWKEDTHPCAHHPFSAPQPRPEAGTQDAASSVETGMLCALAMNLGSVQHFSTRQVQVILRSTTAPLPRTPSPFRHLLHPQSPPPAGGSSGLPPLLKAHPTVQNTPRQTHAHTHTHTRCRKLAIEALVQGLEHAYEGMRVAVYSLVLRGRKGRQGSIG